MMRRLAALVAAGPEHRTAERGLGGTCLAAAATGPEMRSRDRRVVTPVERLNVETLKR